MEVIQEQYKDTKIGRIPKNWEVVILNDLLNLLTDFEANGSFASVKENVQVSEGIDYAWYVRATDLEKKSTLDKVKYVNESSYSFLKKTKLDGDEVLITKRGEIGKVYHFEKPLDTPCTLAPNLYLLKINDKVFSKYLYYYFKNNEGSKLLKRINGSTTIGALYKNDVKKIKVKLPPLPEQQKIAEILSTVDEQISATECIIEKSKELKKGLMQKLFSEGIGHTEFKDTKIGRIPKDWEVVSLGNALSKIVGGGTPSRSISEYWNGEIPWASVKDFTKARRSSTKEYITQDGLKNSSSNLIPKNTLIIPTRMGLGRVIEFDVDVAINQDLKALFPKNNLLNDFLNCWLQSIAKKIKDQGTGSTVKGIRLDLLKSFLMVLPSLSEQQKIAEILSEADAKIEKEEQEKAHLEQLKKGLMQQLLTGQKRVKV